MCAKAKRTQRRRRLDPPPPDPPPSIDPPPPIAFEPRRGGLRPEIADALDTLTRALREKQAEWDADHHVNAPLSRKAASDD